MNSPSDWTSPEHWHMIVKQGLTLLALVGLISAQNVDNLDARLYACITAAFMFGVNGWALVTYIKQQFALRRTQAPSTPSSQVLPALLLGGLVLAASTGGASAAEPCLCGPVCVCPSCPCSPEFTAILPWRQRIEDQLRQLQQQQQQQQHQPPAPLIIQQPPLQVLPIAGDPRQVLPIQGDPRQQLPVPGDPRQQLPIGGQPLQPLPPSGTPQQQLPITGPNPQPLAPTPAMPTATGQPGPQTYTRHRYYALHKGD